jgi:hypothetical protein
VGAAADARVGADLRHGGPALASHLAVQRAAPSATRRSSAASAGAGAAAPRGGHARSC